MSKERKAELDKRDFTINQQTGEIMHLVTGYRCAMLWPEVQAMNDRDWIIWLRHEYEQALNHRPESPHRAAFMRFKTRMAAAKAAFEGEANAAFADLQREIMGVTK